MLDRHQRHRQTLANPFGRSRSKARSSARLNFERFEARMVMTAEGSPFVVDTLLDTTGLQGSLSATAAWGDGSTSSLSVTAPPAAGPLRARIDYSLDTNSFFNTAEKRTTLQLAIDSVLARFSDTLQAIVPAGSNTWFARVRHPATGNTVDIPNPSIAANEILVFAGARNLPGSQVGDGGPGAFGAGGTQDWLNTVQSRGQAGALQNPATDIGLWGGQLAFDNQTNWHFSESIVGLETSETDFYSIAVHEFAHLLGFGIENPVPGMASTWERLVSNGKFTGAKAKAAYDVGGNVPLSADLGHWQDGTTDEGADTLMDPSILKGTRKLLTSLDFAALGDLGWQTIDSKVRVTGEHFYGDNGSFPVSLTLKGSRIGERATNLNAAITNALPVLLSQTNRTIRVAQPLSINDLGVFTDAGFGAPNATPPRTESFSYRIDWGDGTAAETGSATIDKLGQAGVATSGSFNGTHTYNTIGNFTVTYSVTDDDGGTASKAFQVEVTAEPKLTIALDRTQISEKDSLAAATLKVTRVGFPLAEQTVVSLSVSDLSEASLPASITFPANVAEINVPIDAVDDDLLDGLQRVTFRASVDTVFSNEAILDVLDFEKLDLTLGASSVIENAGTQATTLTVRRPNTDRSNAVTVTLISSDESEVKLPVTVTIPANEESVTVPVEAIDDALFDGQQSVSISAQADGYMIGQGTLAVSDFEPIVVGLVTSGHGEQESQRAGRALVTIPQPAGQTGLVVNLQVDSRNDLSVPTSVIIPAGSSSVEFSFDVLNDYLVEGTEQVSIAASAVGYVAANAAVSIDDDDLPLWQNPDYHEDVTDNGTVTPQDALLIINHLIRFGVSQMIPGQSAESPPYIDVSGNGLIEPLDALLVINELNRR